MAYFYRVEEMKANLYGYTFASGPHVYNLKLLRRQYQNMIRKLCNLRLFRNSNFHDCTISNNDLANIRTYEVEASLNSVSKLGKCGNDL